MRSLLVGLVLVAVNVPSPRLARAQPPTNPATSGAPRQFPAGPAVGAYRPNPAAAAFPEQQFARPASIAETMAQLPASVRGAAPNPSAGGALNRPQPTAACDESPSRSIVAMVGYDSWREISDGSWQNNGLHVGLNYGTKLGAFSDLTGIGFQIGGSVGVFDWSGTDYRLTDNNTAETQGFLTYGFFRKPNENSRWSAAVVQDWMFNDNFGIFAQNPTLSQIRWQAGYALNASNEIGMWGANRVLGDTRIVAGAGATSWRAVDQLNPFWHHKWGTGGADTVIWVGVADAHRLAGNGSLGDYIAGALANVPLSDRVGLYTLVTYMHPSSRPGPAGSLEDAWNFTIGVQFYPSRNARSSTVAGRCWLPWLPIANNGLFMVDTNRTF